MSARGYEIRAYRPGDEEAILAAFNRVFARVDPGFVPRTLEQWRWLYRDNPSGLRAQLAVADDGRVLAQYAGIPQRVRIDGGTTYFSQSVDSMSDPDARRLTREPLFVQAGRAFDATFGGTGPEKDTLMWGLPVPVAFRIGRKALKYELVRQQHKLVATHASLALPATALEAEELDAFPEDVAALFERLAEEHRALAVRDLAHMRWRYATNPNHSYRIAVVRAEGALRGLLVYRKGSFDLVEDGLLVDWMVPGDDADARAALLAWAAAASAADGCGGLTAVFPDTAAEWVAFQELGFRVHASRYFLVAWSFSERHTLPWMRAHWYYTLGDTDLA